MAYATTSDVAARVGTFTIDGSSQPTTTEVGDFLDERSGQIDAVLSSAGVSVPVTSPSSFTNYLRGLEAAGATADALAVKFPDGSGAGSVEETIAYWLKVWDDGMAGLKNGSLIPDGVSQTDAGLPTSFFREYPDEAPDLGSLLESGIRRDRTY